ncbi:MULTISPECIES: DUF305 domain-containing protein [unclassified Nocardioides]|uniref:DUF305 domain-containing protein n=1 Tax=unclassified Nocardioides TaxID=2615069 RepID=UPI0009F089DD|nr:MULTISPECIES: DUF305 domain-containing protein [unclassified Nocardioides]GAW49740.1 uncharacterized protein PD653B2_2067 [Nocardioides sp. PD653-B2]GAW56520.1 uncharacterized protein PD653_3957 [Nocardioides sp. PD653]
MKRALMSVAFAVVAALTVAGCGSDTDSNDSTGSSGAQFNDADVTFAQSMIPHHEQAVEMATMAQERASSPEVKQLAEKIEAAQGPEIDTMTGWLEDWGQEVSSDSEGGMDHSGSDMSGMMSDADMESLGTATGAGFDQMFLEMMIEHHTGAIEMAKTEQQDGENPDAIALAEKIEADQTAEIAQMEDLLGS